MTKLRFIITILLISLTSLATVPVRAQAEDDTTNRLLQKVRITFNQNNEQEFYDAVGNYRNHLLKHGDTSGYYLAWKNEVLYDVNHHHFYRAMRKTMAMQSDMEKRGATNEYYKTTHLRGIIYSLRGNISLARQYFEKALDQVDHAQPANLISLYMDLSNIEMDTQPEEAMKHLNCAIDVIKANGASYEYSDAIGFKVIVAYAMRDWHQVDETFAEYMKLRKTLGQDFSTTYYNYAVICKSAADKRYDDAIAVYRTLQSADNGEYAGEANSREAELYFNNKDFVSAENAIEEATSNPRSDYWSAKTFILWAEIFYINGNTLQAKQTLQSIIDHYDGDDLVQEATQRRNEIIQDENAIKAQAEADSKAEKELEEINVDEN